MKKSTLTICVFFAILISNNVLGQSRLGWTISEISKDFTKEKYPVQGVARNKFTDGFHMYVSSSIGDAVYFTNEDSICTKCVFIPSSDSSFNLFVKMYNSDSKIVDNKSWIYSNKKTGSIMLIKIIEDSLDGYNSKCGSYFEYTSLN